MTFSDADYFEVIQNNKDVKFAFESIKDICNKLHTETGCPEEDIDNFLHFIANKWLD
tara:strand:+ start:2743 stop:2913 length:171 start_codon:yes stop_codon:yes gene_type:complete